ncbi:hypothetical protein V2J09_003687 [Rumex salicifolius]
MVQDQSGIDTPLGSDGDTSGGRLTFKPSENISKHYFDLLHLDLWAPFHVPSLNGERFFFTLVDHMSRATWTYVLDVIKWFIAYVRNQFGKTPKAVRSDNGSELVNVDKRGGNKMDPRGRECFLIGYPVHQKGYRLYDIHNKVIFHSRDVFFHEEVFPYKQPSFVYSSVVVPQNNSVVEEDDSPFVVNHFSHEASLPESREDAEMVIDSATNDFTAIEPNAPNSLDVFDVSVYVNGSPQVEVRQGARVRNAPSWFSYYAIVAQNVTDTPSYFASLTPVLNTHEPISYEEARGKHEWEQAMEKELTPLANGSIEGYKACLVVKGFNQKLGKDYKHTFSPMAKRPTVRIVIAMATSKEWPLHQWDVNNKFLHEYLE